MKDEQDAGTGRHGDGVDDETQGRGKADACHAHAGEDARAAGRSLRCARNCENISHRAALYNAIEQPVLS